MKRKLTVYSTHTETQEFRIWDSELRQILKLPKRLGKFTVAALEGQRLTLTFTNQRGKRTVIN